MNELWAVTLRVTEHNAEIARDAAAIRRVARSERVLRSGLAVRAAAVLRDFADRLDSETAPEHSFHRVTDS